MRKRFLAFLTIALLITAAPALSSVDKTSSGEMIYFVMLDRFANGDPSNDDGKLGTNPKVSGLLKSNNGFYHGGDLIGITRKIPYIKSLGFTAIWITPIVRQIPVAPDGNSSAYHGYWGAGFDAVDPHLGTMDDFKSFVDSAHQAGLKVILDIVTNHTGDTIHYLEGNVYVPLNDKPYRDSKGKVINLKKLTSIAKSPTLVPEKSFAKTPKVYKADQRVKSPAWLNDVTNYHNRGDSTFQGESSLFGDFFGLDDLFTEKPEVVSGFIDIYSKWITETGIDGFRIDTVKHVNPEFWRKFLPAMRATAAKSGKTTFPMWGEIFDTDPNATSFWVRQGDFGEVLDFPFQQRVVDFVTNRTAMPLATLFNSDDFYLRNGVDVNRLGTFLGNHDMGRIGSFIGTARGDEIALKQSQLAHALLFLLRGTPIVYYGDEFGLMGGSDKDARQDLFPTEVSSWQVEKRIGQGPIGKGDSFETSNPLQETIRTLTSLRRNNPALVSGNQVIRHAGGGWFAVSRSSPSDSHELLAIFNSNDEAASLTISIDSTSSWKQLAGSGSAVSNDEQVEVTLPGISWAIYRTEKSQMKSGLSIAINRLRVDPLNSDRVEISAKVTGVPADAVTFFSQVKSGSWNEVGTDLSPSFSRNPPDNGLYRIFAPRASYEPGKTITIKAVAKVGDEEITSAERTITLKK
ncbi:MAG: hypothetical protein EBY74_02095 [Actinobacteria bacterium]|nr:hypothetical protein [Actinomycetota bacterium]